jgi:hypothetical protein
MSNGEGVLLPEQRLSSECRDDVAELARLLRVPVEAAAILFSTGFNQCRERAKEARRAYGEQCRAQGHGVAGSPERACKETLCPCDCGCGRSCCAFCGNDLGYIQPATPTPGGTP